MSMLKIIPELAPARTAVPRTSGEKKIDLPFVKTFSDVPLRKPLIYIDSRGHFALAVNQGSFARVYGIKVPAKFTIPPAK